MGIKQAQGVPDFSQYSVGVPDFSQYRTETPDFSQYRTKPEASSYSVPSFSAVKNMQQAIIDFANTLSVHPAMSMQGTGTQEKLRDAGDMENLGGATAFGRFLVDQYVNNADVVGKQFINIGLAEPQHSQTAMPNVNLAGIISTIQRVGGPGAENKPDGIWQARTNNALKQIYAVGLALMQMAKDLNVSIGGFTVDFNKFKQLIPDSYTQLTSDKNKVSTLATVLTNYIQQITELYKQFENAILNKPDYKDLIEQDKPLVNHSDQYLNVLKPGNLDTNEEAFYEANKGAAIPGAIINGKQVKLMDVANMAAFKNFLQSAGIDSSKPDNVKQQLDSIKTSLTAGADFGAGF